MNERLLTTSSVDRGVLSCVPPAPLARRLQSGFPFTVHAYPKSITCMASSEEIMRQWVDMLMKPLEAYRDELGPV